MDRRTAFVLAACAGLCVAGSASAGVHIGVDLGGYYAPPVVVAPAPPPPIREEVVPVPPGPPDRAVWVQGHYEWSGRGYFWVNGHYIERPEPGLFWEPGRWIPRHGHWEWTGGHWRR
jgi:hypothetical protein